MGEGRSSRILDHLGRSRKSISHGSMEEARDECEDYNVLW